MRKITIIVAFVLLLAGGYALWAGDMYYGSAAAKRSWATGETAERADSDRKMAAEDEQSAVQCFWAGGASLVAGIGALVFLLSGRAAAHSLKPPTPASRPTGV